MKNLLIIFFCYISLYLCQEIPNPNKEPLKCGDYRDITIGSICDPDKYLTYDQIKEEMSIVNQIQNKYIIQCKTPRNVQVGIALLKTYTDGKSIIKKAKSIYDSWGIGYEDCGSGILLLLSVEHHKFHVVTGSKIKQKLTDQLAKRILGRMTVELQNENYHKAIMIFLNCTDEVLKNGDLKEDVNYFSVFCVFGLIFAMIAFICNDYYKSQKEQKQFEKLLTSLKQIKRQKEHPENYECNSCPICLEDFDDSKDIITLLCGHKYCKECLKKYCESGKESCPICRRNLFSNEEQKRDDDSSAPSTSNDNCNNNSSTIPEAANNIDSELYFRFNSLRNIHPGYISNSTIERWRNNNFEEDFVVEEREMPMNHTREYNTSDYSAFGGGNSNDSGGASGSW